MLCQFSSIFSFSSRLFNVLLGLILTSLNFSSINSMLILVLYPIRVEKEKTQLACECDELASKVEDANRGKVSWLQLIIFLYTLHHFF